MKGIRKDKREYFKFISARRMNNIFEQLRLIGNLSNKNNYSYTKEDLDYLFAELDSRVDDLKEKMYRVFDKKERFSWDERLCSGGETKEGTSNETN